MVTTLTSPWRSNLRTAVPLQQRRRLSEASKRSVRFSSTTKVVQASLEDLGLASAAGAGRAGKPSASRSDLSTGRPLPKRRATMASVMPFGQDVQYDRDHDNRPGRRPSTTRPEDRTGSTSAAPTWPLWSPEARPDEGQGG